MKLYQPNFNDPRVRARCLKAIGFVCGVMSETKPQQWSSRYIDRYLGISSNRLSLYLREKLLICVDEYYRYNTSERGICKKYLLNYRGLESLRENLNLTNIRNYPSVLQVAREDHKEELDTGLFQYQDLSQRLWHPLQRYRKQYRNQILSDSGYIHDYDISTSAPTLIYQYAQQLGMDEYLFALRRYLLDKNQIRCEIAEQIELPIEAVKEIITALFAGAVISKHTDSDIYHILNGDLARIEYLKQNPYLIELRKDIKTCWEYIRPVMPKRTKLLDNGLEKLCRITARQKWHLYFQLERQVMNSVRSYLDQRSVRYFLIHDGWSSDREIDLEQLSNFVRDQTEFNLKFDYKRLCENTCEELVRDV